MSDQRRCAFDGGVCHHHCDLGECFRGKCCDPLCDPDPGHPQTGKYEAKVESTRTISIEWSGAIFDDARSARNWALKIKRQWVAEGVDPASINTSVAKTPHDDSIKGAAR